MAYIFRRKDKNGKPVGPWKFQYTDWQGVRKSATGYSSKKETEQLAAKIEREHQEIRKGYRPMPNACDRHAKKQVQEIIDMYLEWGRSQGGRGGRPWSRTHARNRKMFISWWKNQLGLNFLGDLDNILPNAESALRELQAQKKSGKTLASYSEALKSFCNWCVERGFLAENPVRYIKGFDTSPKTKRRAMNSKEIAQLLAAVPMHRRLLYATALSSGLRARELRCLSIDDLDDSDCGLKLKSEWTKNRKPGFQPLPRSLVVELKKFAQGDKARELYDKKYGLSRSNPDVPPNPLLYVPTQPAREFYRDIDKANVAKWKPNEGKIDFHSLRVTFISLLLEKGAGLREAMELARHGTASLTMEVYGRASHERLKGLTEAISQSVLSEKSIKKASRKAAGCESACDTTPSVVAAVGLEPTTFGL
ncbi:MAG: tyrosine-type recombinase/integrase [Planctomycetota bacterium]